MPENVRKEAEALAKSCNLKYPEPLGADKFKILEETLKCRIFVYSSDGEGGLNVVYRPRNNDRDTPLYIIGYDRETTHYYPITNSSIKLTFGNVNPKNIKGQIFCSKCYSFVTNMVYHLEKECDFYKCKQCLTYTCSGAKDNDGDVFLHCPICNRSFYNAQCLKNHENNVCKKIRICNMCDEKIFADNKGEFRHDCVHVRCLKCDVKYNPDNGAHECFMKPLEKKNDKEWEKKKDVFTFYYDVETYRHNEREKEGKR